MLLAWHTGAKRTLLHSQVRRGSFTGSLTSSGICQVTLYAGKA